MTRSYTLGEHFEAFVQHQVASGRYSDPSDVVKAGLQLLEERENLTSEVRSTIEASRRSSRTIPAEEVFGRVESRIKEKLAGAGESASFPSGQKPICSRSAFLLQRTIHIEL